MRKSAVPLFIIKTWEMLQVPTHFPTLRWSLQGDSFQITDETRFVEEVLPLYFKHANLSSFIRQLNMYNFHKRKTSEGHIDFRHKLFRRNQEQLLLGIKRKPSEADLVLGDQLIRQFMPEASKENIPGELQKAEEMFRPEKDQEEDSNSNQLRERLNDPQQESIEEREGFLEMMRPVFGVMSWVQNGGQFNVGAPKKIRTTIIKGPPPCLDSENIAF